MLKRKWKKWPSRRSV